jgi:hypothetical protein
MCPAKVVMCVEGTANSKWNWVQMAYLGSPPADDGQGKHDGRDAAVGHDDDHDGEDLIVGRGLRPLDDRIGGDVVEGAHGVGGVGGERFRASCRPVVDMQVPVNALLK